MLRLSLTQIGKTTLFKYISLGILSGLFSFIFINLATKAIALIGSGTYKTISEFHVLLFVTVIIVVILTRRLLSLMVIKLCQKIFWKLRMEILELAIKANYQQLLVMRAKIWKSLSGDIYTLSDAATNIIEFAIALILTFSCLIYLFSINQVLFLITFVTIAVGILIYYLGSAKSQPAFRKITFRQSCNVCMAIAQYIKYIIVIAVGDFEHSSTYKCGTSFCGFHHIIVIHYAKPGNL